MPVMGINLVKYYYINRKPIIRQTVVNDYFGALDISQDTKFVYFKAWFQEYFT